jgi:methylmalonyl-CoA/ethylmalonyl-CoA epimerase
MYEIDHVAIAVEDLERAVDTFVDTAGTEHVWTFESDEWEYRTAYMLAGDDMFTFIVPTSDESFIADYLDRRGPGLHHMGVSVGDLDAAVEAFTAAGGEVIMTDTIPDARDEATLHPKSWFGIQLQLIEWHDAVGPTPRDHVAAIRAAKDRSQ